MNPASLTVTAHDAGRLYGAANPTFTVSYTGFQNSDTAANLTALPSVTAAATPASSIGTYPIAASGAAATNYSFSYLPGSLTVSTAVLTVTAHDAGRLYGATNSTFTVSYAGFQNSDTAANLTALPTVTTAATPASPVGTYQIAASGAAATNYSFSYLPGLLTVNQAPLAVTANATARIYGAANPTFTVSYTGFQNGDTAANLTTLPTVTTAATPASPSDISDRRERCSCHQL